MEIYQFDYQNGVSLYLGDLHTWRHMVFTISFGIVFPMYIIFNFIKIFRAVFEKTLFLDVGSGYTMYIKINRMKKEKYSGEINLIHFHPKFKSVFNFQ